MKIKTKLDLNTVISLGTVMLILVSLVWSWREIRDVERELELINAMRRTAFERILLRDEYLQYQEERSAKQWRTKSADLRKLFDSAGLLFDEKENRALLLAARQDFDATVAGFSAVIAVSSGRVMGADTSGGFSEAEQRQISQVFLKAYSLTDNINRLQESAQAKAQTARNRGVITVLFFISGGIIAIIVNSTVIRRTLAKRISTLGVGVETIGSGNLDYCIALEGDDELTALARASNEMAASLKKSYTSVEHLKNQIIERIHAEEALKESEKKLQEGLTELQRSNKELEQFAYVASHDLQEPLRMVSSYTQLLAERYQDKLDDKANLFIHYAVDGAVRMQLLINDLLAFSRIGTKGKPLEPVDAHAVLGQAINNLKMTIDETQAIISNEQLPEVKADSSQLVQLFQNLIGNSLKFRGEAYPLIHVAAQDKGIEWLFSVRDNGIGIDPQFSDKVFVIFQRLHTKEEYPGSGIGLAICKKIVERHGGRIWFESEPGKGATFYFTIHK